MRQLEIIHLRLSGEPVEKFSDRIAESLKIADECTEAVTLYQRKGLETDIVIHISSHEAPGAEGPSSLGVQLASALRSFGLVEHTLWEELR